MSSGSVGGVRRPTTSSAPSPNSSRPDPTMSAPASMIGICTAKRCGRLMSSASMRATTSWRQAVSPASSAGPRPTLRSSSTTSTGTGLVAARSAMRSASAGATGPSRTTTTWSGGRVWSITVERNATVRCSGRSRCHTGSSSDSRSRTSTPLRDRFRAIPSRSVSTSATRVTRDTPATRAARPCRSATLTPAPPYGCESGDGEGACRSGLRAARNGPGFRRRRPSRRCRDGVAAGPEAPAGGRPGIAGRWPYRNGI